MIIKMNSPADPLEEGRSSEELLLEVSRLLDRTDRELAELRDQLPVIHAGDSVRCEIFESFARRLIRGSESVGLGVLQASGSDLLTLIEKRSNPPEPTAKFRFLLFTALELIAIELRRIRTASAN
jgi:hypothetical protein